MYKFDDSFARMCDEIRQLQEKEGPHYEHWLEQWSKAIQDKGTKISERYGQSKWLYGMEAFLAKEEWRKREGC